MCHNQPAGLSRDSVLVVAASSCVVARRHQQHPRPVLAGTSLWSRDFRWVYLTLSTQLFVNLITSVCILHV